MMNAVSPTAIGMNVKVAAAAVQVLNGQDDPGAGGLGVWACGRVGASLRDRALRSCRRCASIPLRSLAPAPFGRCALTLARRHAALAAVRSSGRQYAPRVRAVMAAENLPLVGKLLGHRRHRTTAGYAHLADAHLVEAAERDDAVIATAMAANSEIPRTR